MKMKTMLIIALLGAICHSTLAQPGNARSQVVVDMYTVNIYTVTGTGAKGTLITSSSSIQENTVYYVEVSTSTSDVAGLLCRFFDGFESGYWSGGFVPYTDPTLAQGDSDSFAFRIRTASGWDFVTPLSMRVYQCKYLEGSCDNPGGSGWKDQRLVAFP